MYLTNLFVFNPQSKKYSKKQTLLQVNINLFSGVVYLLTYKTYTVHRHNSDAIRFRVAQYV